MTDSSRNSAAAADVDSNRDPAAGEFDSRQFVRFAFYKLDRTWLSLPPEQQMDSKAGFIDMVKNFSRRMLLKSYSLVGIRGDVDFLLWQIAYQPDIFQQFETRMRDTRLGQFLTTPHAYFAQTKRSIYDIPGEEDGDLQRLIIDPGERNYLFVYPFVKTRAWYALDMDVRQRMIDEHIQVGRKFPNIRLNTTYSYGLDDQEFVVAFETDEAGDFLNLVMELRETEASAYTLKDTPTFTCISCSLPEMLDSLGGEPVQIAAVESEGDGWVSVARLDEIPAGQPQLVFAGSRQLALFNIDGRIFAVDNRCPHARGPLCHGRLSRTGKGETDGSGHPTISCPWHHATFDLITGAAQPGSITEASVPVYNVKVTDGIVSVHIAHP